MKKISLIVILIFIALNISVAHKNSGKEPLEQKAKGNKVNDWENPTMIGRNKEAAHCTYIPYADIETALKNNPSQSPYYLSLNGTWKFKSILFQRYPLQAQNTTQPIEFLAVAISLLITVLSPRTPICLRCPGLA